LAIAPLDSFRIRYALLVSELMRMDEAGRAKFLTFVSACPHLPPVGLKSLAISVIALDGT
jgi:hypothetical protein